MEVVLEDNILNEFIDNYIHEPATKYGQLLEAMKKNVAKARRILLEGFRDHIVSKIHEKETYYVMWK